MEINLYKSQFVAKFLAIFDAFTQRSPRGSRLLSWRWVWAKSDLAPVVLGATLHRVFLGKIRTGNHGMPWNVTVTI